MGSAVEHAGRASQAYVQDLSHVTGSAAASRNRAISAVINEDLPNLRLTFTPEYNPFIRTGIAQEGMGTQIGRNVFDSRQSLRNTIVHEELHHRWWARGKYNHHPRGSESEARFYETIRRYERLRGFE
jgi:hypothetical protein